MSIQVQPPVSVVKSEPLAIIKIEPPESDIGVDDILDSPDIIPDIKNIDFGSLIKYEDSIKSETVTQVFIKTENASFEKIENITQSKTLIKTEGDTRKLNANVATGQAVAEVQGSNENVNAFDECETTSWEEVNEKIKVIEGPVIPVKPHEYTSLAEDKHLCNHCQHACDKLKRLKFHITKLHREVTTMYQCSFCPFKSKWRLSVRLHVIQKHQDTKDVQWFQYSCEKCAFVSGKYSKFRLHELSHKTIAEMDDRDLKYRCDECDYKTYRHENFKRHTLIHLKSEQMQYLYCYHCPYKSARRHNLTAHIAKHFRNGDVPFHCHICDFMTLKRDLIIEHFKTHFKHHSKCDKTKDQLEPKITKTREKRYCCKKCDYKACRREALRRHELIHLKPEEIHYFYCYHCSYRCKRKDQLKTHIFRHLNKDEITFDCYICDFMSSRRNVVIEHIKKHSEVQVKLEIKEES